MSRDEVGRTDLQIVTPVTRRCAFSALTVILTGCATTADRTLVMKELAPSGTLRAGINFGNSLLTKRPATGGVPGGVAVDLAGELAKRLGVPLTLVTFDSPGQAADAVAQGAWDVVFLASGPERGATIDFSPPYVQLEASYLVAPGSSIGTVEQADRPGVRIGVGAKTAYELYLTRTLRNAELVRVRTNAEAIELMRQRRIDAIAALSEMLQSYVKQVPGSIVLPGHFVLADQSVGTPKGRSAGAQFVARFVEEAKSSGLIEELIKRNGAHGLLVAPPAATR